MIQLPNVALCGMMGAGKSTIAANLVERYGYRRLAFADPLKEMFVLKNGRPIDKSKDREALQALGKQWRDVDVNFWVDKLLLRLREVGDHGPFVIDDLRFLNEAQALSSDFHPGFKIVRVATLTTDCAYRLTMRDGKFDSAWLNDSSEREFLKIPTDAHIPGDGDTSRNVDALLMELTHEQYAPGD